jgi:hypothetical protein
MKNYFKIKHTNLFYNFVNKLKFIWTKKILMAFEHWQFNKTTTFKFNGVALSTENGKINILKHTGLKILRIKLELNIDDQFEITMSNSKQITAVLIERSRKGKINLQSPIKNIYLN